MEIRLLGAWLDDQLKFSVHVLKKCKTAMWNLRKIQNIRKYLDNDSCCTLILRLYPRNSILAKASENIISKYQCIQNLAAKIL